MPPVNGYYTLIISSCRRLLQIQPERKKRTPSPFLFFIFFFTFVNLEIDPQECARIDFNWTLDRSVPDSPNPVYTS
jgi:hypothetical protein